MRRYLLFIPLFIALFALPVRAYNVGDRAVFNVDSGYDYEGREEVAATLRYEGSHIYFYVEDKYWNGLGAADRDALKSQLNILANEFDNKIYPQEREVFGSEWNPGIDNDAKVSVLVLKLINKAGGYFNIFDEYPKSVIENSNEREMFYLNVLTIFSKESRAYLAHEFQHLITFYQKTKLHGIGENVWLNEARSEYAPTLCGYDRPFSGSYLADRVDAFIDNPSDSLTEWKNEISDYGAASMFLRYLVGRYGTGFLTKMMMANTPGIASIEQAIKGMGYNESFSDVFSDWTVANYLNDCQLGTQYCYNNGDLTYERLHIDYSASYSGFPNLIVSRSSSLKDWASSWYQFRQGTARATSNDTLKLEFQGLGDRSSFRVPYIIIGPNNETTVSQINLTDQKGEIYIPDFSSMAKSVVIAPFNQYSTNGFGSNEPATAFSFTASSVALEGPIINSVTPNKGSIDGGLDVTIQGDNFININKVMLGDMDIVDFNVIDSKTIAFKTPAYHEGILDLTISDKLGNQTVLRNAFTYGNTEGSYPEGSLLRAIGNYKVYIIKGGYKRWIITAELFNMYGHLKWEDVMNVDSQVLAQYQESKMIRALGDESVYEINSDGTKHWLNITASQFSESGRNWDSVYVVNGFERDYYKTGTDIMN